MTAPHNREEGSALVMVLVFTMTMSIVLAAVLTLAQTSQKTTVALRSEATSSYNVDGAIQQAINAMQRGDFVNNEGQPCFDPSEASSDDPRKMDFQDGTGSVAVYCDGVFGSGAQSPDVPITSVNKPGNAILTLGSTEGVYLDSTYNLFNRFDVGGPVFSSGPIRTNGRNLNAREYVIARGACSDPTKYTPSAQCNFGSTYDVRGVDPNYPLPGSVPEYKPLPSVSVSSCFLGVLSTISFDPGYYNDAAGLNAITSRGCSYHFKPGTYYFDFHNGDNPALEASTHEWRITSGRLIGGTRTGFLNLDCVSPLKSTTNNGVRFIFGGNSRLVVDGGTAAICGTYSSSQPAIAIQGVKTGAESSQSVTGLAATGQSSVAKFTRNPGDQSNVSWQGVTAGNDSVTAQWSKTTNPSEAGHLALTGYALGTAVPKGSVIDSATVRLRRSNANAQTADTRAVVLTVAGNSCTLPVADTATASLITESLNVLTACPDTFVKGLHASGVPATGTTLRYNVTLTRAGTEVLDQLTLDLTYRAPAFRSQQNAVTGDSCVLGNAFIPSFAPGGATGCAGLQLHAEVFSFIPSLNSSAINGTVYMPVSSISVQMDAVSVSALRSGVISRSLYFRTTGVLNYASVASIPFSSQGQDPSAYLTAYVCETAPRCTEAGAVRVRAKVTVVTPDLTNTSSRRAAKIVSYSVLQ